MFRIIILTYLAVTIQGASIPAFHRNNRNIFPNGKIVGGTATTIEQVPWQVALEDNGYLFCGGSIISKNFVLTAAHCTDGHNAGTISVRSGTTKLESGGSTTKVGTIFQHPTFTQSTLDCDVSVLKLSTPLTINGSTRKPIALRSTEAKTDEKGQVTGWGTLSSGSSDLPSILQAVNVPIVDHALCYDVYEGAITSNMICAGIPGRDSCQGDSGGAITISGVQVGIVSWGIGCALPGFPGVYSNVVTLRKFIDTKSNNEAKWV